jgi:hypothetical protein
MIHERAVDRVINNSERPIHLHPHLHGVRVVQAVKNFSKIPGVCHIGLGVTALNNMKVLRREGVYIECWATQTAQELKDKLAKAQRDANAQGKVPVSHVIISSPAWVQPEDFAELSHEYSDVEFVLENHSGAAYLSIDKYGIRNNRQVIDMQLSSHNIRVAANNTRVVESLSQMFDFKCLYLPNLYDVESFVHPYPMHKDVSVLRVGSFGASRPWKAQLSAAQGAVIMARQMGVHLELFVNSKRPDGGERMIESRMEIFENLRGCKLVNVPWESWPRFRQTMSTMNLLFQPSFDETFNVCVADAISVGVPAVTSSAIEWTPRQWHSHPEDPEDIARVGFYLLNDKFAVEHARKDLKRYVEHGINCWLKYLLRK